MKKKQYETPYCRAVQLLGPPLMLSGANSVNEYGKGNDITIGDEDDESPTRKRSIWSNTGAM